MEYLLSVCKSNSGVGHFPLPGKGYLSPVAEQGLLNTTCHRQRLFNTGEWPSLIASSVSDQG